MVRRLNNLSVSSSSHPFFTGSKGLIDTEGRVDKFTKRYAKKREENQKIKEKEEIAKEAKKAKTPNKKTTTRKK